VKLRHSFLLITLLASLLFPTNASATKWAYSFVVWDGAVYVVKDELITEIDKEIGHVTIYSDMSEYPGNFSNVYQKGTKYYSIKGISTNESIAVQIGEDTYKRADRKGEYALGEPVNTPKNIIQNSTIESFEDNADKDNNTRLIVQLLIICLGILLVIRRVKR
jgi:hypothetical protein